MCILTVESHQGAALWCHCCNHWLSGDIKHHSLHSNHIEYILAWSRETALQMLLHGMLLQKVACTKGRWTKKELKEKEKDIWDQIKRGDVRVESVSEQEVVPKCATPGCDFESKASCGWVTCCKKCPITNGQDHGARCDSRRWQRKEEEEEEDAGEQEEPQEESPIEQEENQDEEEHEGWEKIGVPLEELEDSDWDEEQARIWFEEHDGEEQIELAKKRRNITSEVRSPWLKQHNTTGEVPPPWLKRRNITR